MRSWTRTGRQTLTSVDQLPQHFIDAIVSTEDVNFFEHVGFDKEAVARAAYQNFLTGEITSGASTITQQLVRNTILPVEERGEVSVRRKIKEILLAYNLEQRFTKDQILEMYLNEIYFGNLAYGIAAAVETYFGKPLYELTLAEAALLAGLPQAPASYDPFSNPQAAKARQAEVLDLMVEHGYLAEEEATAAKEAPLNFERRAIEIKAPHFVFHVLDTVAQRYGRDALYNQGLKIETTLDMRLQETAEAVARAHIGDIRASNATNAALVSLDPNTGQILAMVGSVDYYNSSIAGEVNVATAERQPGSSIKPITYAAAFARGITPATIVEDKPTKLPPGIDGKPYEPKNHDDRYRGRMTIRYALAESRNVPAVHVLERVGVESMTELARTMGITTLVDPWRYGLSITLGGGEVKLLDMTGVYGAFATQGGRTS